MKYHAYIYIYTIFLQKLNCNNWLIVYFLNQYVFKASCNLYIYIYIKLYVLILVTDLDKSWIISVTYFMSILSYISFKLKRKYTYFYPN